MWYFIAARPQRSRETPNHSWLQSLRNIEVWRAGALFGAQNLAFSTVLIWLPFLIGSQDTSRLALGLFAMNASIVLPSLWLGLSHYRYLSRPSFYIVASACAVLGAAGLAMGIRPIAWLLASMVGLGTGLVAIGALTLPSVRGESPVEVATYSALMLTLGYGFSIVGPAAGGFIMEHTHDVGSAFYPAVLASILMGVCGLMLARNLEGLDSG
jgi:cyanate permease